MTWVLKCLAPSLLVGEVTCQTFPTGMFFGKCLQNFHKSPLEGGQSTKFYTTVIWEACEPKSQSSANLHIPFAYAIYSALKYHAIFKYNILTRYAIFIAVHNAHKNQTYQRSQWNCILVRFFS